MNKKTLIVSVAVFAVVGFFIWGFGVNLQTLTPFEKLILAILVVVLINTEKIDFTTDYGKRF